MNAPHKPVSMTPTPEQIAKHYQVPRPLTAEEAIAINNAGNKVVRPLALEPMEPAAAPSELAEFEHLIINNLSAIGVNPAKAYDHAEQTLDTYPERTNDSAMAPGKRAPDYLDDAAATYRQRNVIYGDNYRKFGHMLAAMYPQGLTLRTAEDFNRLGVFVQCLSKVSRYAETLTTGGHADSALDLATYAAMLRELTE